MVYHRAWGCRQGSLYPQHVWKLWCEVMAVIRRQVLLAAEQDRALKRLARRTGQSAAALVRERVALRLGQEQAADAAWGALLLEWSRRAADGRPRTWRRADLYHDRAPGQ